MPKPFPPDKTFAELGLDPKRKFIVVNDKHHYLFCDGDILEFVSGENYHAPFFRRISDGQEYDVCLWRLAYADETINETKSKFMSIKEKLRNAFLKGTDKVLVTANIEDPVGTLTSDGKEAFNDFLYRKHRDEFAEEVKQVMAEDEE